MKHFTINAENNITLHASAQDAESVANAERFSTSAALEKLADKWPTVRLVEIWNSLSGATPIRKFTDRKTAATRIWKAIQSLGETTAPTSEVAPAEAPATKLTPEVIEAAIPPSFQTETRVAEAPASQPEPPKTSAVPPATDAPAELVAAEQPVSHVAAAETVASAGAHAPDVAPTTTPATKKATRAKKAPTGQTNAGAPREGSKTSRVIEMLKREGGATLEQIMAEMGWQQHTTRAMMSAGGSLAKKHGMVVTSQKVGDQRTYFIKG